MVGSPGEGRNKTQVDDEDGRGLVTREWMPIPGIGNSNIPPPGFKLHGPPPVKDATSFLAGQCGRVCHLARKGLVLLGHVQCRNIGRDTADAARQHRSGRLLCQSRQPRNGRDPVKLRAGLGEGGPTRQSGQADDWSFHSAFQVRINNHARRDHQETQLVPQHLSSIFAISGSMPARVMMTVSPLRVCSRRENWGKMGKHISPCSPLD